MITAAQHLKIFQVLEGIYGKEKATIVVEQIEQIIEAKFDEKKETLATKLDISDVKIELANTKTDLVDRIHRAKIETIIWIVGIGILQLVGAYFLRK